MDTVFRFIQATPWWAFAVFVVMTATGVQALKPRVVGMPRLLLTPAVFIGWGLATLVTAAAPSLLLDWLLTAIAGGILAAITIGNDAMRVDRDQRLVHVPGSWAPLLRVLLIFAAKYAITAIGTARPELRGALVPWNMAVSGLGAGYFLGWLGRFALAYRNTPSVPLAAVSPRHN